MTKMVVEAFVPDETRKSKPDEEIWHHIDAGLVLAGASKNIEHMIERELLHETGDGDVVPFGWRFQAIGETE